MSRLHGVSRSRPVAWRARWFRGAIGAATFDRPSRRPRAHGRQPRLVATATALADVLGFALGAWLLWRSRTPGLAPLRLATLTERSALWRLLRLNVDIFLRTLFLQLAFAWFARVGARLGDTTLAANALLLNFQTFMAYGLDGFAHAAEALVGAYVGARERQALLHAIRLSLGWALACASGFALVYAVAGGAIIDALTDQPVLRETALSLTASLKQLDTEIEKHASALTGYEGIVSIKGVGPRSAAVLLAAIGNVHDFESADKLAAYFGMVPRVAQSNETDHRGRITKRGNKLARTTLVQCSLVATRYSPYLKNFHERIRQRRGTGKAIIATARKLLSIIYDTLKNGWVFSDFTTFSRSEPTLAAGQSS